MFGSEHTKFSASPAPAGGLKQVTEISIPGDPIAEALSHTEESAGKAALEHLEPLKRLTPDCCYA